eukprot:TRINITY_DN674_c0_g1_i9.p1 TRINITY_DN674_c0_g1~~TRINITY_DN674_c0_g1_i9.p1  ORF type:complete len:502 (+),score=114.65 TRINITY_DN674_c0_g1_i9:71-1576(+)
MSRQVQFATAALLTAAMSASAADVPSTPPNLEAQMSGTIDVRGRTYSIEGGDILIDNGPVEAVETPPVKGVRSLGNSDIGAQGSTRWPNLEVVYEIHWSLSNGAIDNLRAAIAAIETETCIRFRECSGSNCVLPYALVSDDGTARCYSESGVNQQGQVNVLNIGHGCSVGTAIHELLHTLGILHEQSRSDRDSFVTINTANIQQGMEPQFAIRGQEDVGPYDYGSIMHYGPTFFSNNGQNTIQAPSPWDTVIGQRNALSAGDIATIDHIYGILPGPFDTSFTVEIRCNDFWEHELHVLNFNPNNVNGDAYNQFNLYDYTTGTEVYLGYIRDGHFPTPLEVGHVYYVKHGVWNCKTSWQESRIYGISVKPSDVVACTPSIQCSGELTVVEIQKCVTSCGIDKKTGDHMIMSYFGLSVSPQKCHNGIVKVEYLNTDNWPVNLFTTHFFPWRNIYCTAGAYNMVATIYFKDGPTATRSLYSQECDDDVPLLGKPKSLKQDEKRN